MSVSLSALRVGFVGAGAMGGPMVRRLLAAGAVVAVHDRDAAAVAGLVRQGAIAAATPAAAARQAQVLVVMVHDAEQVDEVLWGQDGAARALPPGAAVWLASTVAPARARAQAERLAAIGCEPVDGPVSGGVSGARSGTLTVMAAGSARALDAAAPVMQACAARVLRVGPPGAGATCKMINQVLTASHLAMAAEALAFGRRAGVDLELLVELVRGSAGNSVMFDKRAPRMVAGEHEPQATLKTFIKDLDIALEAAGQWRFPLPLAAAARDAFGRAAAAGSENDSDTRLLRAYPEAAAEPQP
ncbi:MAG: NAD(P)-dependent oxidoreductase [Rubrivivax sp.]